MNECLTVLLKSKDQGQRQQAEEYIANLLKHPLDACEQLISAIEQQSDISLLSSAILYKDLKQQVTQSALLRCNSQYNEQFSGFLIRLLQQQAQAPNDQLDHIISILLTFMTSHGKVYSFPQILEYVTAAMQQNSIETQLHLAKILYNLAYVPLQKIQSSLNLDIMSYFLQTLKVINQDPNRTLDPQEVKLKVTCIKAIALIVGKNKQYLKAPDKQAFRQLCMNNFVSVIQLGEQIAKPACEDIGFLYTDDDLTTEEKQFGMQFVANVLQSNFSNEFKGAILTLVQSIVSLNVQADTELMADFIIHVILPIMVDWAQRNIQIGAQDNSSETDNLISECVTLLEDSAEIYGGEYIILVSDKTSSVSKSFFFIFLYQCYEYLHSQYNSDQICSLNDQIIEKMNSATDLELFLGLKLLVEVGFYENLDNGPPYKRLEQCIHFASEVLNRPALQQQSVWALKFIINIMSNREIYLTFRDQILSILKRQSASQDFCSKANQLAIYSSIVVYEQTDKFLEIIPPVLQASWDEYSEIYQYFRANPSAQLHSNQQEYLQRIIELFYFMLIYYPAMMKDHVNQLLEKQTYILQVLIETEQLTQVEKAVQLSTRILHNITKACQQGQISKEVLKSHVQMLYQLLTIPFKRERNVTDFNQEQSLIVCLQELIKMINISPQDWTFCVKELQTYIQDFYAAQEETSLTIINAWGGIASIYFYMSQEVFEEGTMLIIDQLSQMNDDRSTHNCIFSCESLVKALHHINKFINIVVKHYKQVMTEDAETIVLNSYDLLFGYFKKFQEQFIIEKSLSIQDKSELQAQAVLKMLITFLQDAFQQMSESYYIIFHILQGDALQFIEKHQNQLANLYFYIQLPETILSKIQSSEQIEYQLSIMEQCQIQTSTYLAVGFCKWGSQEQIYQALNIEQSLLNTIINIFLRQQCGHDQALKNFFMFFIVLCYNLSFQLPDTLPIQDVINTLQDIIENIPQIESYYTLLILGQCALVALYTAKEKDQNLFYRNVVQIKTYGDTGCFITNILDILYNTGTRDQQLNLLQHIILPIGFGDNYKELCSTLSQTKQLLTQMLIEYQHNIVPQSELIRNNVEEFMKYG